MNYTSQNQRNFYPNYVAGPNPIQAPNAINNSNQINPQYTFPQPIMANNFVPGYNPVNAIPSQINPGRQILIPKSNIPPIQKSNVIQPQAFNTNNSNIINNQSKKINNNLVNIKQNQIPTNNNINIPYNQGIISNQVIPLYNQNINQNIINESTNKNSISQTQRKPESLNDHRPIPMKLSMKAMKSTCKISYNYNNKPNFGTGFFMKFSDSLKLLITNYHAIFPELMNINIQIEIWNKKKMILNLKGRYIKFMKIPKDITAIEIKETDEIYKYIEFLNYDLNYNHKGYNIYNNSFVFSIHYPLGLDATDASGKIINIYNNFEFAHNIPTENGSSGCPIILLNEMMTVIGIHKNTYIMSKINGGTFIGEIINEINNDLNLRNKKNNENYIIGEINIKRKDIDKKIRIINSYEEYMRNKHWKIKEELKNEEKIKECEIIINNKLYSFSYFFNFKKEGRYIIKYKFKNYFPNTSYMFSECKSLINLDLSNFNTQNVTNMEYMFGGCELLTNLNLSNFNTQNVTNMEYMFCRCKSLTNLNLSNFDTQNVTNMGFMFFICKSLTNLNLSNFNTQNVTDMGFMFSGCKLLTNLNLSNFNTQNVTNMGHMFNGCESLKKGTVITKDTKIIKELKEDKII